MGVGEGGLGWLEGGKGEEGNGCRKRTGEGKGGGMEVNIANIKENTKNIWNSEENLLTQKSA